MQNESRGSPCLPWSLGALLVSFVSNEVVGEGRFPAKDPEAGDGRPVWSQREMAKPRLFTRAVPSHRCFSSSPSAPLPSASKLPPGAFRGPHAPHPCSLRAGCCGTQVAPLNTLTLLGEQAEGVLLRSLWVPLPWAPGAHSRGSCVCNGCGRPPLPVHGDQRVHRQLQGVKLGKVRCSAAALDRAQ